MADKPVSALAGLRILVVEDEYMVAELLCLILERLGCIVVGPHAAVVEAVAAIPGAALDGAVIDANLDGHSSGPVAAALNEAGVPFVVATGYGALSLLDPLLEKAPRLSKPFNGAELEASLHAAFIPQA